MASKKKNVEVKLAEAVVIPVIEPVVVPEEPQEVRKALTQEEMLMMQLYEEEALSSDAVIKLTVYEKDVFLRQIDPSGKLAIFMRTIKSNTDKNAAAKHKARELKSQIEKRLDVKLEECSYNELTGELFKPER